MTETRTKALAIIHRASGISAAAFAETMWPDSPHWRESYQCGAYGSSKGRGVVMAGGSYLGKLKKAGLVYSAYADRTGFHLTPAGEKALAGSEATV
jgi:hypothetical protein